MSNGKRGWRIEFAVLEFIHNIRKNAKERKRDGMVDEREEKNKGRVTHIYHF